MSTDFEKLCKIIVVTDGNPSCQQVKKCGYSFEAFLRLSQPNVSRYVLVQKAKEALYDRGYRRIGDVCLHQEG